jgi:two-component system, OmpR family, response regulator
VTEYKHASGCPNYGRLIVAPLTNMSSDKLIDAEGYLCKKAGKLKVLIVDDEIDICFLLSGMLRQRDLRPSYVNTISDAQIALMEEPPSLLFLDNHLPDGHGLDFIRFVKSKYPDTRIIMITAHDSAEDRRKAANEGADYFLSKPFTRNQINSIIDHLS